MVSQSGFPKAGMASHTTWGTLRLPLAFPDIPRVSERPMLTIYRAACGNLVSQQHAFYPPGILNPTGLSWQVRSCLSGMSVKTHAIW